MVVPLQDFAVKGMIRPFEMRRAGVPVNVVATEEATPPAAVAAWVERLLTPGPGGPTGELVRLGGEHLGKALP